MEALTRLDENIKIISKFSLEDLYNNSKAAKNVKTYKIKMSTLNFASCGSSYLFKHYLYSHSLNRQSRLKYIIGAVPLTALSVLLGLGIVPTLVLAGIGAGKGVYNTRNSKDILEMVKGWCYRSEINICMRSLLGTTDEHSIQIIENGSKRDPDQEVNMSIRINIDENEYYNIANNIKNMIEILEETGNAKHTKVLVSVYSYIMWSIHDPIKNKPPIDQDMIDLIKCYESIADRKNWIDHNFIKNIYIGDLNYV